MNLLAGILILLCLAGSEINGFEAADDLWIRLLAISVTAMVVPGMAFFQTAVLMPKMRSDLLSFDAKRKLCRRMTAYHAVVWLSASLAIVWALRWQDVVRGNWQMNQWPLIDELVILAPILFSMVASWAVFYELQAAMVETIHPAKIKRSGSTERLRIRWTRIKQSIRPRLDFISIRFRLYFLLALLPISLFVLIRDLVTIAAELPETVTTLIFIIGSVSVLLFFPLLMLTIWKTSRIKPSRFRNELLSICKNNELRVFDIRRWDTGSQVINAVVVGMVPRFRMILVSDGLLDHFKPNEIKAVLRHEAGHIRLWHLPTRFFFMVLPLVVLAICDAQGFLLQSEPGKIGSILNLPTVLLLAAVAVYVFLTTIWLSHQMEYEADIYSVQSDPKQPVVGEKHIRPICPERTRDMRSALLRLAAISPSELNRRSFFHPSLRDRLNFIDRVSESASFATRFKSGFARRRRVLSLLLVGVCICLFLLLRM